MWIPVPAPATTLLPAPHSVGGGRSIPARSPNKKCGGIFKYNKCVEETVVSGCGPEVGIYNRCPMPSTPLTSPSSPWRLLNPQLSRSLRRPATHCSIQPHPQSVVKVVEPNRTFGKDPIVDMAIVKQGQQLADRCAFKDCLPSKALRLG